MQSSFQAKMYSEERGGETWVSLDSLKRKEKDESHTIVCDGDDLLDDQKSVAEDRRRVSSVVGVLQEGKCVKSQTFREEF